MAKNKKVVKTKRPAKARVGGGGGLDPQSLAYARLLADPCSAPLTHPTYAGGEGGYLIRTDAWQTFGFSAGSTSGYFHWTPGYMGTDSHELFVAEAAAPNTPIVPTPFAGVPGKGFIPAQASQFRCVAACVRVTYPGAEADRSGRVHLGLTNGGLIISGGAVSPDQIATALGNYSRTPAAEIELRWKPSDADQLFVTPTTTTKPEDRQRRTACTVAWAGLPAATGLVFHMTAVYEWQPVAGTGLAVPSTSRSTTRNTLDQVINFIERAGQGYISGMHATVNDRLGQYLSGAFGLMGSTIAGRNTRALTY